MKIAFFSTQPYDKEYFERHNRQHEIIFFEAQLNEQTVNLARGCNAICAFVNVECNGY
jgi:D-lactate dehydrogenase